MVDLIRDAGGSVVNNPAAKVTELYVRAEDNEVFRLSKQYTDQQIAQIPPSSGGGDDEPSPPPSMALVVLAATGDPADCSVDVPLGRSFYEVTETGTITFHFPENPTRGDEVFLLITCPINVYGFLTFPQGLAWAYPQPLTSIGAPAKSTVLPLYFVWTGSIWVNTNLLLSAISEPAKPIVGTPDVFIYTGDNDGMLVVSTPNEDASVSTAFLDPIQGTEYILNHGAYFFRDQAFVDGQSYDLVSYYTDITGGRPSGEQVTQSFVYHAPTQAPSVAPQIGTGQVSLLSVNQTELHFDVGLIAPDGSAFPNAELVYKINGSDVDLSTYSPSDVFDFNTVMFGGEGRKLEHVEIDHSDLSAGTGYEMRTRYVNSIGAGPWSEPVLTQLNIVQ